MIEVKEVGIIQNTGGLWKEKTCYLTGEHFKDGEQLVILVPSSEMRKKLKKIKGNLVAYLTKVEEICANVETVEEFWLYLDTYKTPKIALTQEQETKIDIFIKAAYNCDFKDASKKKDGTVVCKQYGTSDSVKYNVHSGSITYHNRRRRKLFDSFIEKQIVTNVYNEFHKLLKDGEHSDYNAIEAFSDCMDKVIKTTNDIMGRQIKEDY